MTESSLTPNDARCLATQEKIVQKHPAKTNEHKNAGLHVYLMKECFSFYFQIVFTLMTLISNRITGKAGMQDRAKP